MDFAKALFARALDHFSVMSAEYVYIYVVESMMNTYRAAVHLFRFSLCVFLIETLLLDGYAEFSVLMTVKERTRFVSAAIRYTA